MADVKKFVNTGTYPNDRTGDPLRTAGEKLNKLFGGVYVAAEEWFDSDDVFSAAVQAAVADGVKRVIVPSGTFVVQQSITVPVALDVQPGAVIKPVAGATVTIAARPSLPFQQCFDESLGGWVTFASGAVEELRPEWFGAVADGVTDSGPAIQRCLDIAKSLSPTPPAVRLGNGTYYTYRCLALKTSRIQLLGQGSGATSLVGSGYGPFIAVYPEDPVPWFDPQPEPYKAEQRLRPPLVAGDGKSFDIRGDYDPAFANIDVFLHRFLWGWDATRAMRLAGLSAFTVEFYVKIDDYNTYVADGRAASPTSYFFGDWAYYHILSSETRSVLKIGHVNGKPYAQVRIGDTNYKWTGADQLPLNTPHHFAVSYDGATVRFFVNGGLVASGPASGAVTQSEVGSLAIGIVGGFNYESGPLTGEIDAIRISKVARYTAPFTPPFTKWTWDADTRFMLNFDQWYDNFVVAKTEFGDAHMFIRARRTINFAPYWRITGISMSGGYRSGIVTMAAAWEGRIEDVQVGSDNWCIWLGDNSYLTRLKTVKITTYSEVGPFTILGAGAAGASSAEDLNVTGGLIPVWGFSGGATRLWIEPGSGSSLCTLYLNGPLIVYGTGMPSEAGAWKTKAFVVVDGWGKLIIYSGSLEARPWVPVVRVVQSGEVMVRLHDVMITRYARGPNDPSQAEEPIVKFDSTIRSAPSWGVSLHNCLIKDGAKTADGRDLPVTNRPEWTLLSNVVRKPGLLSHRFTPSSEACKVEEISTGGSVVPNAGEASSLVYRVQTTSPITIEMPVNQRPGQRLTITVRNEAGAPIDVSFSDGYSMAPWVSPAPDNSRSITFSTTGPFPFEVARTPSDVPIPTAAPDTLPGVAVWFVADDISLPDGSLVTSWTDRIRGLIATPPDATRRPTLLANFVDGHKAVYFTSNQWLYVPNDPSFVANNEPIYIFAIGRGVLDPGGVHYVVKNPLNMTQWKLSLSYGNALQIYQVGGGTVSHQDPVSDSPVSLTYRGTMDAAYLYINGVEGYSHLDPNTNFWGPVPPEQQSGPPSNLGLFIGGGPYSWPQGQSYDMDGLNFGSVRIAELVVGKGELSSGLVSAIHAYFARRYPSIPFAPECQ